MGMKPLSLGEIARVCGGTYVGPEEKKAACITGAVRDNREVQPGNLFVCIPGEKNDGHDFAASAYQRGAACCLAQRPLKDAAGPYVLVDSTLEAIKAVGKYYRSLFSVPVIGVTGSVGKTTAKEMIAAVLSAGLNTLKTSANLNNELGVPLTLLQLQEEHQTAVIEMGISEFGEMARLADMVRPDICVMTSIGYCHLENLGDLDGVLRAKSEVYAFMKPGSCAVVCGDDEKLLAFDPGMEKITFGFGPENDYHASRIRNQGFDGICFDIHGPGQTLPDACIPAFGRHMVLAALAADAVAKRLGLSDDAVRAGLQRYAPVGGRANVTHTGYLTVINDCYNANPNSVMASLASLASVAGRRIAVLGDMNELGGSAASMHRRCGECAAENGIDLTVCCGTLSRHTFEGCREKGGGALYFEQKKSLLARLPELVHQGDSVLVKASHSHHFEEIVQELEKLK